MVRTVRGKLFSIVALCLAPVFLATLLFAFATETELQSDAKDDLSRAQAAFSVALEDDVSRLSVAVALIARDPAVVEALQHRESSALSLRLAQFSASYPAVRVLVADAQGQTVAGSDPSLQAPPAASRAGAAGLPFEGVQAEQGAKAVDYILSRPVLPAAAAQPAREHPGRRGRSLPAAAVWPAGGVVVALLRIDHDWLMRARAKTNLEFAIRQGGAFVASTDAHAEVLPHFRPGHLEVHKQPDGRSLTVAAFAPPRLQGGGEVMVVASADITELLRDHRRFLLYRLITLGLVALLALALALHLAARMHEGIETLAASLPALAQRRYEPVTVVRTGDEIERLTLAYNGVLAQLREGELWRRALGKYLSRAALDRVREGELTLGGTVMPATVLFADIRGFTSLAEGRDPAQVLNILNRYFTEMVSAVLTHGGIVDKFIGDAIMAVWGPPHPSPEDALNAVRAALSMRERLQKVNRDLAAMGIPPLRNGIGVHSGSVVAGNLGAEGDATEGTGKMEYTVIGDAVNVAARLEGLTKEMGVDVLLSAETMELVAEQVQAESLSSVQVKGRAQPVEVFRLDGLKRP